MADKKRSFSPAGVPEKSEDYHGSCQFVRTSPNIAAQGVKSVNIDITFEEALRLSVALQSAVSRLNRYHHGTTKGRDMGLCLSVKISDSRIAVIETTMRPAKAAAALVKSDGQS